MPLPIALVGRNKENPEEVSSGIDMSFLATHMPREAQEIPTGIADQDADKIMDIWLNAKKLGKDTFSVKGLSLSSSDVIRLKARGLLSGSSENVKLTPRSKKVIKTMTLGESNKFLEGKKEKSYTEILASMNKKGKQGFRIAEDQGDSGVQGVYSEYSHLISTANVDEYLLRIKTPEGEVLYWSSSMGDWVQDIDSATSSSYEVMEQEVRGLTAKGKFMQGMMTLVKVEAAPEGSNEWDEGDWADHEKDLRRP